jgi:hypothetical protein
LRKLKVLDLSFTKIGDENLEVLTKHLPFISKLYLKSCKEIKEFRLDNLKRLKKLWLGDTNITDQIL